MPEQEETIGNLEAGRRLVESLVGRTVVRAVWADDDPDTEWTGHEYALLYLDDGRVIQFDAYGYDAWGATVTELEPGDEEVLAKRRAKHGTAGKEATPSSSR